MIQVNPDLCVGCFRCFGVCNCTVFSEVDGQAWADPEKRCLKCMHCAAVCPVGAITWNGEPAVEEEVESFPEDFRSEQVKLDRQRRSYRRYMDRPVDDEILKEALELACWAPSAKNEHPTKWIVIRSREVLDDMMNKILAWVQETGNSMEIIESYKEGTNVVMGTAPVILLAYCSDNAVNPKQDTAIAMETLELLLQSQGIGTCWGGYLTRMMNAVPAFKEDFALPEGHSFYGAFMIGYPQDEDYIRVPRRTNQAEILWK